MSSNDYVDANNYISSQNGRRHDDDKITVGSDFASMASPAAGICKSYLTTSDHEKLRKSTISESSKICCEKRILIICICVFATVLVTNATTGFVVWTLLKKTGEEIVQEMTSTIPPIVENETAWHPWTLWSDCSKSCGAGQATTNRTCPVEGACKGDNNETRVCLPGPCTVDADNIVETCVFYGGVYPHNECQAFYNCSEPESNLYKKNSSYIYVDECPSPELFDTNKKACNYFKGVNCKGRTEFFEPCEYLNNQLPTDCLRCTPCASSAFPSCKGLFDGNNVYKSRECSRYYIVCDSNRLIGIKECRRNLYFTPDKRYCLPKEDMPASCGGYAKNCTSLNDGDHRYDGNYPAMFSVCYRQIFERHLWCPFRHIFNEVSGSCVPDSEVSC